MEPALGRLIRVPAREGWDHEGHAFTPWMADNLDQLGEAIGLKLQLEQTEVPVGRYYLDMKLTDEDNRVVIVENQFEQSNHDHLGKLLTYCAGTSAKVVVWLAETITVEHAAALQWLNDHTDEDVGFYGVELRLVQIDSKGPKAPDFRVIVRPNEVSKQGQKEQQQRVVPEWTWELYAARLRVKPDRIAVAQRLVAEVDAAVRARSLPWEAKFRQGYVTFSRAGGYGVVTIDVYWRKPTRFGVKLPATPEELGLESPYPQFEDFWAPEWHEWSWSIPSVDLVPDVSQAIEITRAYQPERGRMPAAPARPG